MGCLNWLTDGLGDLVVDILASDLGHGVAGLNLNRDSLNLGVVNAVLGGDLATSVLDSGLNCVSNSRGNMGIASIELRISLSVRGRGSAGKGEEARNGKNLHF